MSEFKVPNGWNIGIRDGYYTKVIHHSNAIIEINRPILTEEERKKREDDVIRALTAFAREMVLHEKTAPKQNS